MVPQLVLDIAVQFVLSPMIALFIMTPLLDHWVPALQVLPEHWHDEAIALRLPILIQLGVTFHYMVIVPLVVRPMAEKRAHRIAKDERLTLEKIAAAKKAAKKLKAGMGAAGGSAGRNLKKKGEALAAKAKDGISQARDGMSQARGGMSQAREQARSRAESIRNTLLPSASASTSTGPKKKPRPPPTAPPVWPDEAADEAEDGEGDEGAQ